MPRRRAVQRYCTRCNKWYGFVNKIELWTSRESGTRFKQIERLCNDCLPVATATKLFVMAHIRIARAERRSA